MERTRDATRRKDRPRHGAASRIARRIFRSVDGVESELDDRSARIHLWSASRSGDRDLGVNRRRLHEIPSGLRAASTKEPGS